MTDHLAKAEHAVRRYIGPKMSGDVALRAELTAVMANYARLQAVERAAADLLGELDGPNVVMYGFDLDAIDNLRALLTAAGPHQTGPENSNGETP